MEISYYEIEMKRLKNQWPAAYSEERMKIFFNALRDVSNFDFRDAVTHCLATCRSAPLLGELTEAIHVAKNNYFTKKRIEEESYRGMFSGIPEIGWADKEFKDKCIKLFNDKLDKKITREQFFQGCDLLDQAAKLYKKNSNPIISPKQLNKPYKDDLDDDKPF